MSEKKPRDPVHSPEFIRSISEKVYAIELARTDGGNDPEYRALAYLRMIAKDNAAGRDGDKLFSNRAGQYDHLTRAYLAALGIKP